MRKKNHFFIYTVAGFYCPGTSLFWFIVLFQKQVEKNIIELRNMLSKTDSQDTGPGIFTSSDLFNLKSFF